ncbi:MFS transporter [Streptomyces sp. NPDC005356]|uniref:MFS transporter n=1 Tax=Streptomyces sp. NPDC005356 TaxID=3157167 RepID=UPI0033A34675
MSETREPIAAADPPDGPPAKTKNKAEGERSTGFYLFLIVGMVLFLELNAMVIQMVVPALHFMGPTFRGANLSWVLTVVTLVGAALQPLGGKLADMFDVRHIVAVVGVSFVLGSVLCALTESFAVLLCGRVLQSSVMVAPPLAYRVYRDLIPARLVPVALGSVGTGFGVAGLIGPIIAGALVDNLGYRSLFWFFACYGVVIVPVIVAALPNSTRLPGRRLDVLGALLLCGGVAALLLGLSEGAAWGWLSKGTVASVLGGLALLLLFLRVESRAPDPVIPLQLLARPEFLTTILVGVLGMFPLMTYSFGLPQLLEAPKVAGLAHTFGLTALAVGLVQIPYGVFGMVFGPLGGALTRRIGPRKVMIASLCLLSLGALLLGFFHHDLWQIILWSAVVGTGFGLFWAGQANLMVEAVPPDHTGVSGGTQTAAQAVGTSIAIALIGTVLAQHVLRVDASTHATIYSDRGFATVFFLGAAAGLVGVILTLVMRHGRAPASGGSRAASLDE